MIRTKYVSFCFELAWRKKISCSTWKNIEFTKTSSQLWCSCIRVYIHIYLSIRVFTLTKSIQQHVHIISYIPNAVTSKMVRFILCIKLLDFAFNWRHPGANRIFNSCNCHAFYYSNAILPNVYFQCDTSIQTTHRHITIQSEWK